MFRLKCLGGLTLDAEDGTLSAGALQRRRLILLALCAGAGDDGISRDRVLAFLWPESTTADARHALDQLLYASRRELGKDAIVSEAGQLRLNRSLVRCDASEFRQLLQRNEREAAVALYGGAFLDGAHLSASAALEHWIDSERAQLEGQFLTALEELAQAAQARGDLPASLAWWRRRMAAERYSARGALALMRASAADGEVSAGLRYAENYAALLKEEFGTEPNAEILEWVHQMSHAPAARREGSASSPAPIVPDQQPDRTLAALLPAAQARVRGMRAFGWAVAACVAGIGITSAVVLRSRASAAAVAAPREYMPDSTAQALYLRGKLSWDLRSKPGIEQAIVLFRSAIERDPLYPQAHAGLAQAYVILGYLGYVPGDASYPKGKAAALRALELEPQLAEAHTALSIALQWERRWREAERELQLAMRYAPEYATAHQHYALLLTILGRTQEAVAHARRAAELDPLSVQIQNSYAVMLFNAGQRAAALDVYRRIVTDEPDTAWVRQNPWVLSNFGKLLAASGDHQQAIRLIERALEAVPRHPRPLRDLAATYIAMGDSARAEAVFQRADQKHPHYPLYRALLDAALGDVDAAFRQLDYVQEWGPVLLLTLNGGSMSTRLRTDPRFALLQKRLLLR